MNLANLNGPKSLFEREAKLDELQDVIIIGVDRKQQLKIHMTNENPAFLSLCMAFMIRVVTDRFGSTTITK